LKTRTFTIPDKTAHRLTWGILALGAALRTISFLHTRCLILDEVNVALNLYERSFPELLTPLSYEQYAPPIFLLISKAVTGLFGFGALSLRLFPFISGIVVLLLLQKVLVKLVSSQAASYSLLMVATGYIFIRYGTELKQYSSDAAISLGLIYMALNYNRTRTNEWHFVATWTVAGSFAIWASMPSIFVLAGVFASFVLLFYREGLIRLWLIILPAATWAVQFLLYYFIILRDASSSNYLQNWHTTYFISLLPRSEGEWANNLELMNKMLSAVGGVTFLALAFHTTLIIVGLAYLWRSRRPIFLLLTVPFACLFIAAGIHKFTLLPRVILFALPLLLVMISIGWQQLWQTRLLIVKVTVTAVSIVCVINYGRFDLLMHPLEIEEITEGMAIAQHDGIDGQHLYVNYLIGPIFEFYTKIHPDKNRWATLRKASITQWQTNVDSLIATMHGHNAMLYIGLDEQLRNNDITIARKYFFNVTEKKFTGGYLYIFDRK
jgi:hypothetical protein